MLSGQIDVGLPLCIEPSGALLDVVLSALYGWHQHWGGVALAGLIEPRLEPPNVVAI